MTKDDQRLTRVTLIRAKGLQLWEQPLDSEVDGKRADSRYEVRTFLDAESLAEELDRRSIYAEQRAKEAGGEEVQAEGYYGERDAYAKAARLVREGGDG